MQPQNWDATIQKVTSNNFSNESSCKNGSLVKIHPLELENKLVRINQTRTLMGREPSCDIFCDDTSVSRRHAVVVRTENGFELQDCQSTNGTYLDGQRVSNSLLTNGCQIQIGNHIFKFLAGDSIESQYHETVYAMMTKDGLTNVYNKRYLVEALSSEFERSSCYGRAFSLVMMDIDFFKKINDTYGHLAGDEVLQGFATRISQECGAGQVFARFGGEEFAVLLVETEHQKAIEFAERLRIKIEAQTFPTCAGDLVCTASFGVAEFDPQNHETFSSMLEQADQQLYQAKSNGRNQVA